MRPKWEYILAKNLLNDRLSKIDEKFNDLISGRSYVSVKKSFNENEYWEWVNLRLENLNELSIPTINLMVFDLPKSLGVKGGKASEDEILNTVNKIQSIYNELYSFELEGHEIKPPKIFNELHSYQFGWTLVLQDGVKQIHTFLDRVINHDFKSNKHKFQF